MPQAKQSSDYKEPLDTVAQVWAALQTAGWPTDPAQDSRQVRFRLTLGGKVKGITVTEED